VTGFPAQHLAGGWVMVHPSAVAVVCRALLAVEQQHRRDGIAASPEFTHLTATFAEAAGQARASGPGRSEVPQQGGLAASAASVRMVLVDPVSAEQAARIIGCTSRNVRGLCASGAFESAQRGPGGWEIERAEVAERARSVTSPVRVGSGSARWPAVGQQARRGANSRW
jgi:hypothetical protein